jgi:hypothetical protein
MDLPADEDLRRDALAILTAPMPPPVLTGGTHAINDLPITRRALFRYAIDGAPTSALIDDHGRRQPLQAVDDGTTGVVSLELGPGECVGLTPLAAPVAGTHAEVGPAVLDNGRVRAELDAWGRLDRLCFDGVFPNPTAPLPGLTGRSPATLAVTDHGPVRMRVTATMARVRLIYELHAWDDALWLSLTEEDPSRPPRLRLPGTPREAGTDGTGRAFHLPTTTGGIAIVCSRPCRVSSGGGMASRTLMPIDGGGLSVALLDSTAHPDAGDLLRQALVLGRPFPPGHQRQPAACRWWGLGDLVPLTATPHATGLRIRCLNVGHRDHCAYLYPGPGIAVCRLLAADGSVRGDAPRTHEGDGWEIHHRAGEALLLELAR